MPLLSLMEISICHCRNQRRSFKDLVKLSSLKALPGYAHAKTSIFLPKNDKAFYWKRNKDMHLSLNQNAAKKTPQT